MENESIPEFKIKISSNPRYIVLLVLLIIVFCVTLFAFYAFEFNLIFLVMAIGSIFLVSYLIFQSKNLFNQSVKIYPDHIEYRFNRFETEMIFFKKLTYAGDYKKNPDSSRYSFDDGIYLYQSDKDQYLLIRPGFAHFDRLAGILKEEFTRHQVPVRTILRSRTPLKEEIGKLLNQSY